MCVDSHDAFETSQFRDKHTTSPLKVRRSVAINVQGRSWLLPSSKGGHAPTTKRPQNLCASRLKLAESPDRKCLPLLIFPYTLDSTPTSLWNTFPTVSSSTSMGKFPLHSNGACQTSRYTNWCVPTGQVRKELLEAGYIKLSLTGVSVIIVATKRIVNFGDV